MSRHYPTCDCRECEENREREEDREQERLNREKGKADKRAAWSEYILECQRLKMVYNEEVARAKGMMIEALAAYNKGKRLNKERYDGKVQR